MSQFLCLRISRKEVSRREDEITAGLPYRVSLLTKQQIFEVDVIRRFFRQHAQDARNRFYKSLMDITVSQIMIV